MRSFTVILLSVTLLAGCGAAPAQPAGVPPTSPPTSPQMPLAEPTHCAFVQAYGPGEPAVEQALTSELRQASVRLTGPVQSNTYGERACDRFIPQSLDILLTAEVADVGETATLRRQATLVRERVVAIMAASNALSLGNLHLTFAQPGGTATCVWDFAADSCR